MDLSVLERQRAVLQRLHHQNASPWQNQESDQVSAADSRIHRQQAFTQCWQPRIHAPAPETASSSLDSDRVRSFSAASNGNNSSLIRVPIPKPQQQCNSSTVATGKTGFSSSLKKRKAEFDPVEDIKEKGLKSEDVGEEKSEVTAAKPEREVSSNTCSKVSEVQKPDYIHVRARRGQATDSHSLAERARREKISKKMKCLQDLVPGCNKVIGKAGMLDEIINYVQSLQKQVEFLSMKLAAINPRLDFSIDNFFAKEIPAYLATLQPAAAAATSSNICFQYNAIQQGTPSFEADESMDHHQSQLLPQKAAAAPIPDMFLDPASCIPMSGWESDWPSLFNAGFH